MSEQDEAQAQDESGAVVEIWTDGGCKPNPGPGGGVFFCVSGAGKRSFTAVIRKQRITGWN
ncbi:Ribonuclease HI [Gluconobacter morbifer G707]|uniref:Ribonuclease HI n=1 Tax=Gluconobacter morbifer G707 TaxID=1088869 RepID=G6XIM9_9PROT|nr:Ribonuclease HI [Gluconobacter morbifer G707]